MLLEEVIDADDGAGDDSGADFTLAFEGGDVDFVEAALDGFDFGGGAYDRVDADGKAVLDVDVGADRDLASLTKRLQGVEASRLHQANHIRRGIDGRKLMVMRGEGVLVLHTFLCRTFGADGNLFDHKAKTVSECGRNSK